MIRGILKSIKHALRGIMLCIRYERNFRVHLIIMFTSAVIAPYFQLTELQIHSLVITVFLVLCAEAINTAIEITVDSFTPQHNENARNIKDISAGAVLIASVCMLAALLDCFLSPDKIFLMIKDLFFSFKLIFSFFYIIISLSFIYFVDKKNKSGRI